MAITVGLISLGCSKNRVDSELILGHLEKAGFRITADETEAEVIIINTCGFIEPAKEESIGTILEMAQYKTAGRCRLLVVAGCLSQRYPDELREEIPEVDIFWGVKDQGGLVKAISDALGVSYGGCGEARLLTTPPYSAYLRIADGCDNRCTYCAIPLIRGGRVSVPMEKLIEEAEALAENGVRELTVIAQDTSAYGSDIYGKPMLSELLRRLAKIEKLHWIRVLYTYPNTVDEELIDTIIAEPKLVNYIDMPIQHIDPDMLKAMNRHGSAEHIRHITEYIRKKSSDFILRTTVITGFPGETEEQFIRLTDFLQSHSFDRLGAFAYSQEDDTPAAEMPDQIDEDIKQRRLDEVMALQQDISLTYNKKRIGTVTEALIEQVSGDIAYGRTYAEAPEVDGTIMFSLKNKGLRPGDFTMVKITGAGPYDMEGEEI
ncbi:MAG: 30S ribosomal protein S12 methylthiotransferase RimO [Clostridia bacterium]|nr:30S ribosomal protein S12 methylthiotransferase RimO [Clostridia bacterium]